VDLDYVFMGFEVHGCSCAVEFILILRGPSSALTTIDRLIPFLIFVYVCQNYTRVRVSELHQCTCVRITPVYVRQNYTRVRV